MTSLWDLGRKEFYVSITSASNPDLFKDNHPAEFQVQLNHNIILDADEWEVALADIHYVHDFSNIGPNTFLKIRHRRQIFTLTLPQWYCEKLEDLVSFLSAVINTILKQLYETKKKEMRDVVSYLFSHNNQPLSVFRGSEISLAADPEAKSAHQELALPDEANLSSREFSWVDKSPEIEITLDSLDRVRIVCNDPDFDIAFSEQLLELLGLIDEEDLTLKSFNARTLFWELIDEAVSDQENEDFQTKRRKNIEGEGPPSEDEPDGNEREKRSIGENPPAFTKLIEKLTEQRHRLGANPDPKELLQVVGDTVRGHVDDIVKSAVAEKNSGPAIQQVAGKNPEAQEQKQKKELAPQGIVPNELARYFENFAHHTALRKKFQPNSSLMGSESMADLESKIRQCLPLKKPQLLKRFLTRFPKDLESYEKHGYSLGPQASRWPSGSEAEQYIDAAEYRRFIADCENRATDVKEEDKSFRGEGGGFSKYHGFLFGAFIIKKILFGSLSNNILLGGRPGRINPFEVLYVYTDLIKPDPFNEMMSRILISFQNRGLNGERVEFTPNPRQYKLLDKSNISNMKILIGGDRGERVPFQRGPSNVTLHFRRLANRRRRRSRRY